MKRVGLPYGAATPASDSQARRAAHITRFDPLATAAAIATVLVVWLQTYHTLGGERWRHWIDALVNEWLIWFTLVYLALVGAIAVWERLIMPYLDARSTPRQSSPRDT